MAYNDLDLDDFSDSGSPSELSPGNTSQIDIDWQVCVLLHVPLLRRSSLSDNNIDDWSVTESLSTSISQSITSSSLYSAPAPQFHPPQGATAQS